MTKFASLTFGLLLPATAFAAFIDTAGHPYEVAITYVQQQGIVAGYDDGTFKPNATINRAEFTKIIIEAKFSGTDVSGCLQEAGLALLDVPVGSWYEKYVCEAKTRGIISGYPDGTFKPAHSVNYAEAAKIVSLSFGVDTAPEDFEGEWWKPYVYALARAKFAPTPTPSPDQAITRAQMAEIIYRVTNNTPPPSVEDSEEEVIEEEGNTAVSEYTAFNHTIIGNGEPAVLFFHADWCPYCQKNHKNLTQWYAEESFPLNVYKLDFDASVDLRKRYGVISQDTFVLIDGNGDKQHMETFPNEQTLRDLIDGEE